MLHDEWEKKTYIFGLALAKTESSSAEQSSGCITRGLKPFNFKFLNAKHISKE